MKKILSVGAALFVFSFFALTPIAFAQGCAANEKQTQLGCIPNDPTGFSGALYTIGLGLIGGVAVLFLIIGGYYIMMSQGNPVTLNKGKSYMFYAIVGLLLAIFGYIFLEVILVDILRLPGFSK